MKDSLVPKLTSLTLGFGIGVSVLAWCMCLAPFPTKAQQAPIKSTTPQTSSPAGKPSLDQSMEPTTDERYRIGPGDVLEVLVYNHPQLSRPALRVDARGMIRMPLLEGEILAACKTESDLAKELTTRYSEYQKYPQVDVYIKEFSSQPVAIVGAVNSPSRFYLQRRVRLLELLTFAGGPSGSAGRTIQIVHGSGAPRLCDNQSETLEDEARDGLSFYDLNATLRGDESANPYLRPGDVVSIANADQIYVIGNVPRPSAIPLTDELTISRALAMSGGTLPLTDQESIRVIRQEKAGAKKIELLVNLKEINKGRAEDITLQANDVVEVRKAGGVKAILSGLAGAIVPTAVSLPTRVVY